MLQKTSVLENFYLNASLPFISSRSLSLLSILPRSSQAQIANQIIKQEGSMWLQAVSFVIEISFFFCSRSSSQTEVSSVRNVKAGRRSLLIIEWLLCDLRLRRESKCLRQWNSMHLFFCKHPLVNSESFIVLPWMGIRDFYQIIYCERCDKPQSIGLLWRSIELAEETGCVAFALHRFECIQGNVSNQSLR